MRLLRCVGAVAIVGVGGLVLTALVCVGACVILATTDNDE